jgi:hypothetical protein
VTRYLLDTNIISDALKPQPTAAIGKWIESQAGTDLFISTFYTLPYRLLRPLRGLFDRSSSFLSRWDTEDRWPKPDELSVGAVMMGWTVSSTRMPWDWIASMFRPSDTTDGNTVGPGAIRDFFGALDHFKAA